MTQYLLAVQMSAEAALRPEQEMLAMYESVGAFNAELQAAGGWVFAGGLHPPSSASVVHVRDGKVVITDGPFTESKEQLGGMWIIEAADLDAALAWAGKASAACRAPVEVRPFQELPS